MAKWTVTDRIPKGIPKNLPVYVGLGLSAFVITAMLLTTDTGTGVPAEDAPLDAPAVTGSDAEGVMATLAVEAERARQALAELEREQAEAERRRREAEDRRLAQERERDRREVQAAREALERATQLREQEDLSPDQRRELLGTVGSVEEEQLREAMRLAEMERFANSMRAPAMVGLVMAQAAPVPSPAPAPRESDLERLVRLAQEAESAEAAAVPSSGGLPPDAPPLRGDSPPPGGPAMTVQAAAGEPAAAAVDVYPPLSPTGVTEQSGASSAAVARWGDVPDGADLVYEGRMLQATLQTQLSGEFTGPVRALVSIPVRSRDRRRVVIPRGTLALGEAQQVTGAFQGRLAVGFDRLVFPDGRTVRMSFAGLNAVGETGLADEVNRHYVSTFGAVGAVGLLAGLVRGGGGDSFYDPVSQQFALTATQLFDRYMNRLPEITIRAGHPMRIWLTQDLIVPRGGAGRERGL